ncbi:MAG TPA: hypothetical protein VK209_01660 [Candidatus Sulfotelmatobacter sp.]|nr:hypothetical protein [Candidatus Sulfotelmatobacter sp.]
MKKKIIGLGIMLFLLLPMLAPVLAASPGEQKVPITIKFLPVGSATGGERWETPSGIIQRREATKVYNLQLSIDGGPIITGSCTTALVDYMFSGSAQMQILREEYVMVFPSLSASGTFEGNAMLLLTDYVASPLAFNVKAHGVFHGTGDFDGQTINAGYMGPRGGTWEGYLLKP